MFRGHPHIHGRAIHPRLFVSSTHLRCVRLWFMVFTNHPGSGRDNYSIIIRNRLSDLSLLVAHRLFASPPVAFIFLAPLADARHFFRPAPTRAVDGVRELDDIAAGLQQLRDAGVVVLWRPFHEMNGGWFWWGAKKPDVFMQLWRQMFDYFTVQKKLNNLLWVYAANTGGRTTAFYPGDGYVDLVGVMPTPISWTRNISKASRNYCACPSRLVLLNSVRTDHFIRPAIIIISVL